MDKMPLKCTSTFAKC